MPPIKLNAPVQSTKSILINSSLEKVWNILSDIEHWPNWQPDIRYARLNGPFKSGTDFVWKINGFKIHSTLDQLAPLQHFGWSGKSMGIYAIHNWKLHVINGRVNVTVEESMEGLLARLFKHKLTNDLGKSFEKWLQLLKVQCEKE